MFIKILLWAILAFCVAAVIIFSSRRRYCYVFEHREWNLWKEVLKNFDKAEYVEYFKHEGRPEIENYKFRVTLDDGSKYRLIYWVASEDCSVHDYRDCGTECVLSSFDRYHSDIATEMVKKRLGLEE